MPKTETITLFKSSKMKEDIQKISGKLVGLEIPADIEFAAVFEVDESAYKVIKSDPLLQDQKRESILSIYQRLVQTLGQAYKEASDAIQASPMSASEKLAELSKKRQEEMNKALQEAHQEVVKIWAALVKSKKEYATYKSNVVIKLVMDSAALAGAVASMGLAAATFGGTAAISILALIKASAQLAHDILDANKAVEAAVRELKEGLTKLAEDLVRGAPKDKKLTSAKLIAKDIAGLLEGEVLGTNLSGTFLGNLRTVKKQAKLARQKVNGAQVKAHKLAQNLSKILDKQDKLAALLKGLPADTASSRERKRLESVKQKLAKTEPLVNALVMAIPEQLERFKGLDDRLNTLLLYYKQIKAQTGDVQKVSATVEKLLLLKDLALTAIDATSLAAAASEMGKAAAQMIAEKLVDTGTEKLIQLAVDKYYSGVVGEIAKGDAEIEKYDEKE